MLTLDAGADGPERMAEAEVDRIAREVLVNPVIEEYSFRLEAMRRRSAVACG